MRSEAGLLCSREEVERDRDRDWVRDRNRRQRGKQGRKLKSWSARLVITAAVRLYFVFLAVDTLNKYCAGVAWRVQVNGTDV